MVDSTFPIVMGHGFEYRYNDQNNFAMIIKTPEWVTAGADVHNETRELETLVSTVYEPAEDTFLILDALQLDLEKTVCGRLRSADSSSAKCGPLFVVELGSGAGILVTAVAKALSLGDEPFAVGTHCVAVDSNPAACRVTAQTCRLNNVEVDVVHGDLLTWMRRPTPTNKEHPDVYGFIDVMIFNPPYVRDPNGEPAPMPMIPKVDQKDKFLSTLGDIAWLGGGPDGIDVLKRALHQAADLLSERGVFYVLMIDYNYTALVGEEMLAQSKCTGKRPIFQKNSMDYVLFTTFGENPENTPLACRRILSRKVPGERLAVYCVYRPHVNL